LSFLHGYPPNKVRVLDVPSANPNNPFLVLPVRPRDEVAINPCRPRRFRAMDARRRFSASLAAVSTDDVKTGNGGGADGALKIPPIRIILSWVSCWIAGIKKPPPG
jgi:hypothetical protein